MVGTKCPEGFDATVARVMRSINKESIKKCCENGVSEIKSWAPP